MPSQARIESNRVLKRWCASLTGNVLSVGSGSDQDGQGNTYRQYFQRSTSYTTSEVDDAGCDLRLDVRSMPEIPDGAYDVIYCSGVLEHVDDVGAAMRELGRVLKPGGVLLLGLPFRQAIHHAPTDYLRFTEYGVRLLLAQFDIEEIVAIDGASQPLFPAAYWAKARKPMAPVAHANGVPPETVVCWLWPPAPGYDVTYGPGHVNALRRMVKKHYRAPHRFVCITNERDGFDSAVELVKPWDDFVGIESPHGGRFPSCYRRLRMFAPDIAEALGSRFVSLDLDCVITGDITSLLRRPEEFVAWKDTHSRCGYNGSLMLLTAGARRQVWETFDPETSPALTLADGKCNGSDQGWISYCLGPSEAKWTASDGVYSFKNEIKRKPLPANARIVIFHGSLKPWSPEAQLLPWVRKHYQVTA